MWRSASLVSRSLTLPVMQACQLNDCVYIMGRLSAAKRPIESNMTTTAPKFSFHLEGAPASGHAIPASVLVQVVENAQNAVELIGYFVEGKEIKRRLRIPARMSRKYQLVCHVPVAGSYALPLSLGDPLSDLFASDDIQKVWGLFSGLLRGVSACDERLVRDALPDGTVRRRVLE